MPLPLPLKKRFAIPLMFVPAAIIIFYVLLKLFMWLEEPFLPKDVVGIILFSLTNAFLFFYGYGIFLMLVSAVAYCIAKKRKRTEVKRGFGYCFIISTVAFVGFVVACYAYK